LQVNRRLYRCRENRMVAGVASGVAEFFGLDPTLVRILWFLSIFVGGFGILAYIGLAIIVPLEPAGQGQGATDAAHNHGAIAVEGHRHEGNRRSGRASLFLGITLIVVGAFALLEMALPGWASWRQLGPVLLMLFGAFLVFGAMRRNPAGLEMSTAGPGPLAPPAPPPGSEWTDEVAPAEATTEPEPAER